MSAVADPPPNPDPHPAIGYALALVLVAMALVVATAFEGRVSVPNLSLIFVLPVVIVAVRFSWGAALTAAVAGVAGFNFFLIEPRYSFRVDDASNAWALALLLIVAAIVSAVAGQSRRRAMEAQHLVGQADALQGLARSLVGAADQAAIAQAAAEALGQLFSAPAVVLLARSDTLEVAAATAGADLTPADMEAARWALAARLATRSDVYPIEEARYDFWPMTTPSRLQGLVGVRLSGRDEGRPAAPERLIEIVSGYLGVALDRESFAAHAMQTRLATESDKVKADLLAAVSHDLRTPLSTILLTLQSLQRFDSTHDAAARQELLGVAEAETARLFGLVAKLLDMSRIGEGALAVQIQPASLADLVAAALGRAGPALDGHTVTNDAGPDAPSALVDFSLAEAALANVLENAGKYAPAGSTIAVTVSASPQDGMATIAVTDDGPGFAGEAEALFGKFVRGVEGDGRPPGTGLGLAIARGFIEAQGGVITAANRQDGRGGIVTIRLPLAPR